MWFIFNLQKKRNKISLHAVVCTNNNEYGSILSLSTMTVITVQPIWVCVAGADAMWSIPVPCSRSADITIGGHRHRSQCRQYPTSDIDICYSDIGDKYVGLKNVIPISEVFRYWHQSLFRYPILKKKNISSCRFEPTTHGTGYEYYITKLLCLSIYIWMSEIGYRIKVYSDIRYNVGLRSLSPISEVPISGSVRYRWSRISD
jgi:hypothetical protein